MLLLLLPLEAWHVPALKNQKCYVTSQEQYCQRGLFPAWEVATKRSRRCSVGWALHAILSAAATVWVRTWPCLSFLPLSPLSLYPQFPHSVTTLLAPSSSPLLSPTRPPASALSGRRCQLAWEVWSAVSCLSDGSSDTGLGAASAALQLWAGGPWSKIRTLPHLQAQGCPAPRQSSLDYVICSNSIAQICSDWYWGIISLKVLDQKIRICWKICISVCGILSNYHIILCLAQPQLFRLGQIIRLSSDGQNDTQNQLFPMLSTRQVSLHHSVFQISSWQANLNTIIWEFRWLGNTDDDNMT